MSIMQASIDSVTNNMEISGRKYVAITKNVMRENGSNRYVMTRKSREEAMKAAESSNCPQEDIVQRYRLRQA